MLLARLNTATPPISVIVAMAISAVKLTCDTPSAAIRGPISMRMRRMPGSRKSGFAIGQKDTSCAAES